MLIQLAMAMVGVVAFAILFAAPVRHWVPCGVTGMVAWLVYATLLQFDVSSPISMVFATMALTVVARIFAVKLHAPVTIYLVSGIFPLVPGAGIYYSAYYLIMNDFTTAAQQGSDTLKAALAIAIGIVLGSIVPQRWFNLLRKKQKPGGHHELQRRR